jgi:hypothetical protein
MSFHDEVTDGVLRVVAANMNYGLIRLNQKDSGVDLSMEGRSKKTALGMLPGRSHRNRHGTHGERGRG